MFDSKGEKNPIVRIFDQFNNQNLIKSENDKMSIDHDYEFDVDEVVTASKNTSISVLNMSKPNLIVEENNLHICSKFSWNRVIHGNTGGTELWSHQANVDHIIS